jgi:tetratricopeptide (TPR) repeat protein
MYQQRWEEAIEQVEIGIKLDPLNPHVLGLAAVVYWHKGDFEKALKITTENPDIFAYNGIRESHAYQEGNYELSMNLLQNQLQPFLDSASLNQIQEVFIDKGYQASMKLLAESIEKQLDGQTNVILAMYYNRAGMTDDVIRILEYGYQNHDPNMPYVFVPVEMKNLESDPRYQELAKKMNLPY